MRGGYQLLDFGDTKFSSGTPKVIPGSAKTLIDANGKVVILSNLKIGDNYYSDLPFPTTIIDPTVLQSSVVSEIASSSIELNGEKVSLSFKNNDTVTAVITEQVEPENNVAIFDMGGAIIQRCDSYQTTEQVTVAIVPGITKFFDDNKAKIMALKNFYYQKITAYENVPIKNEIASIGAVFDNTNLPEGYHYNSSNQYAVPFDNIKYAFRLPHIYDALSGTWHFLATTADIIFISSDDKIAGQIKA